MRSAITVVILGLVITALARAQEITILSDRELDTVYAQGLNIIGGMTGDIVESTLGDVIQNININGNLDLSGSVFITDNAQGNAWNPVNASNSAVNNSYNIFIILESNLTNPTFNINNALNAINGSNLP